MTAATVSTLNPLTRGGAAASGALRNTRRRTINTSPTASHSHWLRPKSWSKCPATHKIMLSIKFALTERPYVILPQSHPRYLAANRPNKKGGTRRRQIPPHPRRPQSSRRRPGTPAQFLRRPHHGPRRHLQRHRRNQKGLPSAGTIKADFDPVAIARQYHAAGADALSVLTDEKYFHGHLDYIAAVKQAVPLPILRKDFIIDPYQIYESRAAGADAILLIAEILTDAMMIDLQILATELKLTTLVEVHEMDSLLRVNSTMSFPHASYYLLGINNRDLRTFSVDLHNTVRLAEFVENKKILVSESGIKDKSDVQRMAAAGVRTLLIGETLMKSPDVGNTMANLKGTFRKS